MQKEHQQQQEMVNIPHSVGKKDKQEAKDKEDVKVAKVEFLWPNVDKVCRTTDIQCQIVLKLCPWNHRTVIALRPRIPRDTKCGGGGGGRRENIILRFMKCGRN